MSIKCVPLPFLKLLSEGAFIAICKCKKVMPALEVVF